MNTILLTAIKDYVERTEERCDSEWGASRGIDQLIKDGMMPEFYHDIVCMLKEHNDKP